MSATRLLTTVFVAATLGASPASAATYGLLEVSNGFARVHTVSASRITFSVGGEGLVDLDGDEVETSARLDCEARASTGRIVCEGEIALGDESLPVSFVYDDDAAQGLYAPDAPTSASAFSSADWLGTTDGWGYAVPATIFGGWLVITRPAWGHGLLVVSYEGPDIYLDGVCITCIWH